MTERQNIKPIKICRDKDPKYLGEDESRHSLNYSPANIVGGGRRYFGKGTQWPSTINPIINGFLEPISFSLPQGENLTIGSFYDEKTSTAYSFHYNSNGVNFIARYRGGDGVKIVYSNCFNFSPDPTRAITQERCYLKKDYTCKNKDGEYLCFVDGKNEYFVDFQAAVDTNMFTTPYFSFCSNTCDLFNLCVPNPPTCPFIYPVPLTPDEVTLPNYMKGQQMNFRYRFVYYDNIRKSIWGPISAPFYQDDTDSAAVRCRKVKIKLPFGNSMVDKVEVAVSFDGNNNWYKIATIDKYKQYNSTQEKWYQRDLAPLDELNVNDCTFSYTFYNDVALDLVPPSEINRNFNPHPRETQCLFPVNNALAFVNFLKGNCPLEKYEQDKFSVAIDYSRVDKVRGLKSGGEYFFGFILEGDCGRYSFVYAKQGLRMPRIQDKGNFDFYSVKYDFGDMNLPKWVKRVRIVRTDNIRDFRLMWKVDSITFVDNVCKLRIQSLNDYNAASNFSKNTKYQQVKNDRVNIFKNGNGSYFGSLNFEYEIVSTEKGVSTDEFFNTIVIRPKDGGDLTSLVPGALIEIWRKRPLEETLKYKEICVNIPVVDGRVVTPSGYFHTYDTFSFVRKMDTLISTRVEHHSPNDYFVTPVTDTGRVWVVSEFEDEKRHGRRFTINSPNEFSRFGDTEKDFEAQEHGDITIVHTVDGKSGVAIGQYDNITFGINQNNLIVNSQGNVVAAPADQIINESNGKAFGRFGCSYDSIGSFCAADGWVSWVDLDKCAHVIHDYNSAIDVSVGRMKDYFNNVCNYVKNGRFLPSVDKPRVCSIWSSYGDFLFITTKSIRGASVNTNIGISDIPNSTVVYCASASQGGDYLTMLSSTPEFYMRCGSIFDRDAFYICFSKSQPYLYPLKSDIANRFFGVQCDCAVTVSLNKYPEKEKIPSAIEQQDRDLPWYVNRVETDNPQSYSEIPVSYFEAKMDKQNAPFLFNVNSTGGLFGSSGMAEQLRGYHFLVWLVRDNTKNKGYNTIDDEKRGTFTYIDNIIISFTTAEQSGFTQK